MTMKEFVSQPPLMSIFLGNHKVTLHTPLSQNLSSLELVSLPSLSPSTVGGDRDKNS